MYDQGIEIMTREGVEAGIKFFEAHSIETGSLRSLYGQAWGYWVEGSLDDARLVCDYILAQNPHAVLKAHCYYLKGYIGLVQDKYGEAEIYFTKARKIYQEKQRYGDQFKTTLGIASTAILIK